MIRMYDLLAEIEANSMGEHDAMKGYYELLADVENLIDNVPDVGEAAIEELKKLKTELEEIISDEMNHSQILFNYAVKLSQIEPAKD